MAKVCVCTKRLDLIALGKKMIQEGDDVFFVYDGVPVGGGYDLVVTDQSSDTSTVGSGLYYGDSIISRLGVDTSPPDGPVIFQGFVTKWLSNGEYMPQTIIGVGVNGVMNDDLGASVPVGCGLRYVPCTVLDHIFTHSMVKEALGSLRYTGPITLQFNVHTCQIVPVSMSTWPPFNGVLAMMEGLCGIRISDFMMDYKRLQESWSVCSVLSRFPYPNKNPDLRTTISQVRPSVEQHLWTPYGKVYRGSFHTDGPLVGFVTAWGTTLKAATSRVLFSCHDLSFPEKQFRLDINETISKQYGILKNLGVLSSLSDSSIEGILPEEESPLPPPPLPESESPVQYSTPVSSEDTRTPELDPPLRPSRELGESS